MPSLSDIPVSSRSTGDGVGGRISTSDRQLRPEHLAKFMIKQPRLYLTLATMNQFVSVSSFVRGDFGQIGDIEADILIGIGAVEITEHMLQGTTAAVCRVLYAADVGDAAIANEHSRHYFEQ